ncbi:UDP-N-acetylmuramate--L-alanine ligase [Candidatus Berkelbacteria bacterium]|nr:UDP-N-acetylmuramate--L-alanine ligase [Candidatus Berkelbacteria bacterium]
MELNDITSVHLIGNAGVSMSGLAKVLEARGITVTGCDVATNGHDPAHIVSGLDLVVISQAITPQSPGFKEVAKAQELNIPVKTRAWVIGRLMAEAGKLGVAIAGAHGKSTTTAMLGMILVEAGEDPTVVSGAVIKEVNASFRPGRGRHVVVEACEYDKQFLQFVPRAAIITNIDAEHLDTFPKGVPQIVRAFRDFVKLIPSSGVLVINGDDKNLRAVAKSAKCKVKAVSAKEPWPGVDLKIPGEHNVLAATLAAHLAHELGVPAQIIKTALNNFTGLGRRLEQLGVKDGVTVYDDYGHHPSELAVVFKTLRELYPQARLIAVFQPHQANRTKLLFDQFVAVLRQPDLVLLAPVYQVPGRDEPVSVTSEDLARAIGKAATAHPDYSAITAALKQLIKPGDTVVTVGATNINEVGKGLL